MRVRLLTALTVLVLTGCGGGSDPEGVIDRETFIATWVDLRTAAIGAGGRLPDAERTRILERHAVTEDQMLGFADAHGGDPRYMADVWTEVETRMRPAPAPDSTAASAM